MNIPCDASSLISLADNCLLRIVERTGSKFVIPKRVKMEVFDAPFSTKRFKLRAIQINSFIKNGTIAVLDEKSVYDYSQKIAELANSLLSYHGSDIKIIHQGEAEVMACVKFLKADTMLLDERTTRHLIEDPEQLRKYMQARTGLQLEMDNQVRKRLSKELAGIKVIRSAEVFAHAYENKLFHFFGDKGALEAGLYALKFSGCSITDEEINDYIELLG